MNIWRLGTNWGGTPTLNIIQTTKVGFFGIDWPTDGVVPDDIIAIATPGKKTVEAVGIAASKVQPLSEMLNQQEQTGELSRWVNDAKGFRFKKIWTLPKEMQFSTLDYKQLYSLQNDRNAWNEALKIVNIMQSEEKMNDLCNLLTNCKNLILTGAPGTGKTYLAMEIANALTGDTKDTPADKRHSCFVQFHPTYDYADFVEGLRSTKPDENGNIGFIRQDGIFKSFCKRAIEKKSNNFKEAYQSLLKELMEKYSAENPLLLTTDGQDTTFKVYKNSRDNLNLITGTSDKVQGSLTAEKIESFLTSSPYPYWQGYYRGVLQYLTKNHKLNTSQENDNQKYVLIIDEINRGDIAKIFGELFFALDPGYRGKKEYSVRTQYSNLIEDGDVFKDGFYVPDNVYVIGTMNDIDRGVESMDFAIRRRFAWKQVNPEERVSMWTDKLSSDIVVEAGKRMRSLNEAIIAEKDILGSAYQIGPSYFLKLADYKSSAFENLWSYHIEPLIDEYLRGIPDAETIKQKLVNAYNPQNVPESTT